MLTASLTFIRIVYWKWNQLCLSSYNEKYIQYIQLFYIYWRQNRAKQYILYINIFFSTIWEGDLMEIMANCCFHAKLLKIKWFISCWELFLLNYGACNFLWWNFISMRVQRIKIYTLLNSNRNYRLKTYKFLVKLNK